MIIDLQEATLPLSPSSVVQVEVDGHSRSLKLSDIPISDATQLAINNITPAATVATPIKYHSVQSDYTITNPSGNRFIVHGVTMFDYNFVSYETNRVQWDIRINTAITVAAGVSPPTGYARYQYISQDNITAQIAMAKANGVNLIRVAVEPAMLNTLPYTDPSDSKVYPSDMDQLDVIISKANDLGVVVQLQNGNDRVPITMNISFLTALALRYKSNTNVWINPANELNGGNGSGNVSNVSVWQTTIKQYVQALRTNGWLAPIVINPTDYGRNLNAVYSILKSDVVFTTDPNLIVGVHVYPRLGEYDFVNARLPDETPYWPQYLGKICIIVDEFGINNFGSQFDPNLNPSLPQGSATTWAQMQSFTEDFSTWCLSNSLLSGVTGFMWYAYIPGMSQYDLNTMIKTDLSFTTWGNIFKNYYLQPTIKVAAWTAYTPTVTSSVGAITSYTSSGQYIDIGKVRHIQAYAKIVNAGTASSSIHVSLPLDKLPVNSFSLNAIQIASGYSCIARVAGSVNYIDIKKYDGTFPGVTDSQFLVTGFYDIT